MPQAYAAPAPRYPLSAWLRFFARYLLILPLITDPLKWLLTRLAGKAVGRLILGAQNLSVNPLLEIRFGLWLHNNDRLTVTQYRVTTDDHATLDTLEIRPQTLEHALQRPYIINFLGSAQYYQDNVDYPLLDMIRDDALQQNCTLIAFNYRNVMGSTKAPSSVEDLVTDGIAQVQRLLSQGVPPAHIVLNGVSLGAGIATLVAAHFHSQDIPVRLFSDRGFSSLARTIAGWIQIGASDMLTGYIQPVREQDGITGYNRPLGKKLLGWLALPFLKAALYLTGWDIDVTSAYQSIPTTHKALLRIQSSAQRRQENPPPVDDCIIPEAAQLEPSINDLVGNMQTIEAEQHHDAHFKMRDCLISNQNSTQTGLQFYHHAVQRFFQPPPEPVTKATDDYSMVIK